MTRNFLDQNFLLTTPTASKLFHNYAKDLPIIDYHCHIKQQEILDNKQFQNLTQIWLYHDHYKWRAMRSCGVKEYYITGEASDYEKFTAWAKIMPQLIGNPLYHWTHLELQRYFNITDILNQQNADKIWHKANTLLQSGNFNVRDILKISNVETICTTDDPSDDLLTHYQLKNVSSTAILPSFRPDKALDIRNDNYLTYLEKLEAASDIKISSYTDFLHALANRVDFFNSMGCKVSDHGMNYVPFIETSEIEVEQIFADRINQIKLNLNDEIKFKTWTLIFLSAQYAKHNWAMQLHMNVTRNNNTQAFNTIGADSGFDAINDTQLAQPLSRLLDSMNQTGLPKTILYSLNQNDNYVLATLMGCFQGSEIPGKIQLGSGWWFNDQRDGILNQLKSLANLGALGTFIGMLTDSRSFLSYTRHEYFRRIVCDLIGTWVENGEYPDDEETLASLIQNICYYNAKRYFAFGE